MIQRLFQAPCCRGTKDDIKNEVVTAGALRMLSLARGDEPFLYKVRFWHAQSTVLEQSRFCFLAQFAHSPSDAVKRRPLIGIAQRRHSLSNSDVQLQFPAGVRRQ